MRDIRMALRDREAGHGELSLRPLRSGDVGWMIDRQAVLYTWEYGWDWTYEGLASRILGAFVAEFDPSGEDGWVAERGGAIVGSIFLMKSDDPPDRETQAALCRAKRPRVWRRAETSRHVHRSRAGTRLSSSLPCGPTTFWSLRAPSIRRRGSASSSEEPHHSFGHDLVGRTWTLDLD